MGRRRVGGVSSTGRCAAPFLDATDLAMQTAVELRHGVRRRLLGQWKNYGLSLGISSVLGRAGGQGGQGLSIRIFVYVKILIKLLSVLAYGISRATRKRGARLKKDAGGCQIGLMQHRRGRAKLKHRALLAKPAVRPVRTHTRVWATVNTILYHVTTYAS